MVALAGMLATQEVSRVRAEPVQLAVYTVDRHGRQESNIDFLVYSSTIVVHLDVFLLAIVNKKVHFSLLVFHVYLATS